MPFQATTTFLINVLSLDKGMLAPEPGEALKHCVGLRHPLRGAKSSTTPSVAENSTQQIEIVRTRKAFPKYLSERKKSSCRIKLFFLIVEQVHRFFLRIHRYMTAQKNTEKNTL